MSFENWKKQFVQDRNKDSSTLTATGDIIKTNFESVELLTRHYEKHGEEFGNITQEEYLIRANQLLQEPLSEDVEQLIRSDGSISRYKFSTNEFLVVTKDGAIKTFFKPADGKEYWGYEHERN